MHLSKKHYHKGKKKEEEIENFSETINGHKIILARNSYYKSVPFSLLSLVKPAFFMCHSLKLFKDTALFFNHYKINFKKTLDFDFIRLIIVL